MYKKRILMVHNYYQIGGGEDSVFKNEVELLREKGHVVIEYTCNNDELKESKIKLLLLPFTTIWSWNTYFKIKKIIKIQKIDVVHCHNIFPLISPSIYYAAQKYKVPVVQTIHNFRLLCPCGVFYRDGQICEECSIKSSFKSAIKHKCYRNSRIQTLVVAMMLRIHRKLGTFNKINYIFLTEFNKKKFGNLINVSKQNVFVKPNFINESASLDLERKKNNRFIFAGRLDKGKGVLKLVNFWKNISDEYELDIYGEGECENEIFDISKQRQNIVLHGFVTHEILLQEIKQSLAIITPYMWYEGYPMIIAESFSVGCPVIATNIGNAGNIVSASKGGVTFDINSEDSFVQAIEYCVKNNEELSNNAYVYYKENNTRETNYKMLARIYETIG